MRADVQMIVLVLFCQKFRTHLAQTLWYPGMSWAGPWLISNCAAMYLIVIPLSSRMMALACSCLWSLADVDGHPERSTAVTLVRPFLNISIHSYTLHWGNTLSPYWANKCLSHLPPIQNEPQSFVLPWCKSTVVQPCSQSDCNWHTESKVMSSGVWHAALWVSMLLTVSRVDCSCSWQKKKKLWILFEPP
jgi:hypothetical protein